VKHGYSWKNCFHRSIPIQSLSQPPSDASAVVVVVVAVHCFASVGSLNLEIDHGFSRPLDHGSSNLIRPSDFSLGSVQ